MRAVLAAAAVICAAACDGSDRPPPPGAVAKVAIAEVAIAEVTIDELDRQLVAGAWVAVDANGTGTRTKLGVIPGAILLSDSEAFLANELPTDKSRPLVFYCANPHCGASHEAANRARAAGHRDVKVLPDGIAGWVKAGKSVAHI